MSDGADGRDPATGRSDEHLVEVWASAFARAWSDRMGLAAKSATVVGTVVAIAGGIGSGIFTLGVITSEFRDVPDRLDWIETAYRAHVDTMARPGLRQLEEHEERIRALEQNQDDVVESVTEIRSLIYSLDAKVDVALCYAQAAAGVRSPYECGSGGGSGGDGGVAAEGVDG